MNLADRRGNPGVEGNRASCRRMKGVPRRAATARRRTILAASLAVAALSAGLALPREANAQQGGGRKIPIIKKIQGSSFRQAFTGKVESLDTEHKILNMKAAAGGGMEIFPVKKGVEVRTADGEKLKLSQLKSGSNVIIYYQQKGNRRTVKEIIVLAEGAEESKKKPPPPS